MNTPEIVTFYSYKGGTGRSMALANVAWILAANGKRVLVIDWDLEAPGLHRYFHPFLSDQEMVRTDGLIDFILEYAEQAVLPGDKEKDWYKPFANLLYYAASLKYEFPDKGTLDFVPAGRQGVDYATRVNAFNWQHFYERLDGGLLLEAAKLSMAGYDYVLIDSRTGVSDTSGICTVQMPNTLVICFTLNKQSIEGAAAVAESADAQRLNDNGQHTLRILPVPTRVEAKEERMRLDSAMAAAREKFDRFLWHLPGSIDDYWSRVSVQYQPFYAFEEILAVFGDTPGRPQSMLASMEALAGWIATPGNLLPLPEIPTIQRQATIARFLRQRTIQSPYVTSRLTDHGVAVKALYLLAQENLLFSGDSSGRLFQWDLSSFGLQTRFQAPASGIRAISTLRDEILIASTNEMFKLASGPRIWSGPIASPAVRSIAGTAIGIVVYGTDTGHVNVIEFDSSRILGQHSGPVTALTITREGRYAISGSYDRIAIQWDILANSARMTYSGHTDEISAVVLDSTEKWLLTGSADKTLRLWEVDTGRHLSTFEGHTDKIQSVAFSPDGRLAASASADRSVRVWEVATGNCLIHLTGHTDVVNVAVFTPDGLRVVSASDDGSLIVWDIQEASQAVALVQVPVTPEERTLPAAVPQETSERPIPYLAYLSYSREDRDSYFGKFALDLDKEVSRLSNSQGRSVWYAVDDSRGLSDVWSDSPLRSAKVAICLLSPGYLESEHCGREVSLFLQRSSGGRGILPIIWKPLEELPGPFASLNARLGIPAYDEQGLAYIMRLHRYRDEYSQVIQRFATALLRIASESPLEQKPNLPSPEAFPNAFKGVSPGVAEVSCVIRSLLFFGRSLESIVLDAAKDAGAQGVDFTSITPDLLGRTAQTKTTLIVVMDGDNPDLAEFAKTLELQSHCALLVLNRGTTRRPPSGIGYYEQNITTAARLRDAVINAIVKIRSENIRQTVVEDLGPDATASGDEFAPGPDEGPGNPHGSLPSPA